MKRTLEKHALALPETSALLYRVIFLLVGG